MKKWPFLFILFSVISFNTAFCQTKNYWKFSRLLNSKEKASDKKLLFNILFIDSLSLQQYISIHKNVNPTNVLSGHSILTVYTSYKVIEEEFVNRPDVLYINVTRQKPKEELAIKGFDLSANRVSAVHNKYPNINGEGQTVSIKENNYDTTDIDLKGRTLFSPLASLFTDNHANFMATTIAGADNSIYYAKGVAWAALISSSSFDQILPDPDSYYNQYNITVQNHSYGTDIDNMYGLNAAAFDKSSNDNPNLVHVFSSGNSGNLTSTSGRYAGIAGYANITGNFKMSKNSISVGGIDSFGILAPLSSVGPAHDGRIKPEITAFQLNGTSESAALVSGTVLLLQQYYKSLNNVSLTSAMAKAILINSADDIGTPGPHYKTGFGNLNALHAMDEIERNNLFTGNAANQSLQQFTLVIPPNIAKVKVTLCWNDKAAVPSSTVALVNDLDLYVTSTVLPDTIRPWVLNPFPHVDSLSAPAKRKRDNLNNVEQVTINDPLSGNYKINVAGYNVPFGPLPFYIAYSLDTIPYFKWHTPGKNDFIEAAKPTILRWENISNTTGDIQMSYTNNVSWTTFASNVDLTKTYLKWNVPDTIAKVFLRMKIGNNFFYSDTLQISRLVNPTTGFICGDSILVEWKRVKGYDKYILYTPGDRYMMPFREVTDTSVIFSKGSLNGNYISVAGKASDGSIGKRSYALDYTTQAAGCYINSFLASLNSSGINGVNLLLGLGSNLNINSISFEKLKDGNYVNIYTSTANGLQYKFTDLQPAKGIVYYRAKVLLNNGRIIYSDKVAVYFVPAGSYLVFPIPVKKNDDFQILTGIPNGEIIIIRDLLGQIVLQKEIQFVRQYISTRTLIAGAYFYQILKSNAILKTGRLIIL